MVQNRIHPKTRRRYMHRMRDVVRGLSRAVQVYKQPIKSACPNCYYDKMTNRSSGRCVFNEDTVAGTGDNPPTRYQLIQAAEQAQTDWENNGGSGACTADRLRFKYFDHGRCPICLGKGYLEVQRRTWVDCLVTWDPNLGSSTNTLTFTPAGTEGSTIVQLKTNPKHLDLFKNATKIVVDGVECKISRPPIMRGLGNQAIMTITAFTTDKPKIDTDEILKDYTGGG